MMNSHKGITNIYTLKLIQLYSDTGLFYSLNLSFNSMHVYISPAKTSIWKTLHRTCIYICAANPNPRLHFQTEH